MAKEEVASEEVTAYYQTFVDKWRPEGWQSRLHYVNDEFHDAWLIDIYLPGSQRDPQITNIPADGSVPHFMLAKNIYSFNKGIETGMQAAANQFVIQSAARAAEQTASMLRTIPPYLKVTHDVQRLADPRNIVKAVQLLKEEAEHGD